MASLVLAALVTATATACAYPLKDLGPLPPRFSGPPLPADTAVAEMTSVLAAEGITVEREPSNLNGICHEQLMGRHAAETADTALKAAFARARSEHGWQAGPDMGGRTLTLTKNNWTVTAGLPGGQVAQGIEPLIVMSLTCVGGDSTPSATTSSATTSSAATSPPTNALTPSTALTPSPASP
ncbi:hypothetical protein ABT236_28020 [Streptomyces sp. NPDC001523]|uniref:hypothetical protein n=1 Tax=Streptomyces sp. NPDC001523 TaxID=3154383 RepID=UPI003322EBF4